MKTLLFILFLLSVLVNLLFLAYTIVMAGRGGYLDWPVTVYRLRRWYRLSRFRLWLTERADDWGGLVIIVVVIGLLWVGLTLTHA